MFRLDSEAQLVSAFRAIDRKKLELPDRVRYPLTVLDYLAWNDSAGERVHLLFKSPGDQHVTGISFRRDHASPSNAARMCEWCHAYGTGDQINLLSSQVNARRTVGIYLCMDLGCAARAEDQANRRGRSARDAVRDVLQRISRFSEGALGIRQTNRNAANP